MQEKSAISVKKNHKGNTLNYNVWMCSIIKQNLNSKKTQQKQNKPNVYIILFKILRYMACIV